MSVTERAFELIPQINQALADKRPQIAASLQKAGIPISDPDLLPPLAIDCNDDHFYQDFGSHEPFTDSALLISTSAGTQVTVPAQVFLSRTMQMHELNTLPAETLDTALAGIAIVMAMDYYARILYPQDSPEAKANMVVHRQ